MITKMNDVWQSLGILLTGNFRMKNGEHILLLNAVEVIFWSESIFPLGVFPHSQAVCGCLWRFVKYNFLEECVAF